MFPTFKLFGLEVGVYGICAAIGLILAALLTAKLAKKKNINFEDSLLAFLIACGTGFIFAHILYGITNITDIIRLTKDFSSLGLEKYFNQLLNYIGGMVFYGGFIGGVIGLLVFERIYKPLKNNRYDLIDIFSVVFPLFHCFGRIGCFFGGCCYGIESSFGILITNNQINPSINGVTRFPVQLLEALCNLIIFLIMLWLYKKDKQTHKLVFIYMIIYGVVRFLDEFLRGDTYRGFIFGLSTSQFISLILICFSIIMLIILRFKSKKTNTTIDHNQE